MEFLIAPKTQIITLIQSLVLTQGHWRFKGDHRLAATWTGSCSHRWVRSLMVWSAAGKAERGSVTVKAAGEAKAGWGCRLGRWVGGKTMKGRPLRQGGQRSRPSSLQRAQAGPRPAVTNALLSGQGSGSLSEAPLAPPVNTASSHSCGLRDFTTRGVSCSYLGPGGLKPSFFAPFSEREMLGKISQ